MSFNFLTLLLCFLNYEKHEQVNESDLLRIYHDLKTLYLTTLA